MSHYLSPGEYLPHDAPMLLLEEVVRVGEDTAVCCVTVASGGVWSGWHRHQQGQGAISLGMVLGARELICTAGVLPAGKTVSINVKLLMQDDRFGSFECAITADEETLATGRVNTFQPSAEELHSLFQQGASA